MKLLAVDEETLATERLGPGIVTLEALRLLARKIDLRDGVKRSYDAREGRDSVFTQINEFCEPAPFTRDFALGIDAFSRKFLVPVIEKIAARIQAAMPVNAKLFECRALQMPAGIDMAYQVCSPPDGIGIRFIRAYDINVDRFMSCFSVQFRFE